MAWPTTCTKAKSGKTVLKFFCAPANSTKWLSPIPVFGIELFFSLHTGATSFILCWKCPGCDCLNPPHTSAFVDGSEMLRMIYFPGANTMLWRRPGHWLIQHWQLSRHLTRNMAKGVGPGVDQNWKERQHTWLKWFATRYHQTILCGMPFSGVIKMCVCVFSVRP